MQQVVLFGIVYLIGDLGLVWFYVVGKIGISNDMCDSWFVGFIGQYLVVFWMGCDDNKFIGLFGVIGVLCEWCDLFVKLFICLLLVDFGFGLELVWMNFFDGKCIDLQCEGVCQLVVVVGSLLLDIEGCFWQWVGDFFGGSYDNLLLFNFLFVQ